ncbi:MAG: 50S ribosomal protein L6 [Chloroflexi bacterium]|nr:50S ribosomal protein L6 [Chloroflexota bacterium]
MSRIGRMPITVPQGVTISIDGVDVTVKGPKGELHRHFHHDMTITLEDNTLKVARPSDDTTHRALHGLTRSLLANMIEGVTKGYERGLELAGVGYRVEQSGDKLLMRIGFSHTVEVPPSPGISLKAEGTTRIKVIGIDKEAVGKIAASIRAMRPIDSYKGKGIKYAGEVVRRKAGKAGKAVGSKA